MMMRLVAVLALVAVALAQEDDGSYNAEKYENPYAYSEQQAPQQYQVYQPQVPQYQPQVPQYQPQAPQYQPQVPQYQPQVPQYQPQAPQYQPQPQYQPAATQYQPQVPQYQPQVPQYQPQVPQYQPQVPQYQPQVPQYSRAPVAAPSPNAIPQTSTNYKTKDHERYENVDGQGNVRGQYSYVDPNGKTITVKYTAGKDGFQVEGDHLPRPPVPGAAPAPAAPAAPQAYQPRYIQPAPAAAYQPRYQPAPAVPATPAAPGAYFSPAQRGPLTAADQFLSSPLQHRFASAPGQPAYQG